MAVDGRAVVWCGGWLAGLVGGLGGCLVGG